MEPDAFFLPSERKYDANLVISHSKAGGRSRVLDGKGAKRNDQAVLQWFNVPEMKISLNVRTNVTTLFFLYAKAVLAGAVSKSAIVLGHQLILFVIIASNGI